MTNIIQSHRLSIANPKTLRTGILVHKTNKSSILGVRRHIETIFQKSQQVCFVSDVMLIEQIIGVQK